MELEAFHWTEHLLTIIVLSGTAITTAYFLYKKFISKAFCKTCEIIENIYKMPRRLQIIYDEVRTNNGKSLKDKVNQIADCQKRLFHNQRLFEEKYKIILDDHPIALLETDAEGKVTWANSTYLELTGRTLSEVLDNGWINVICAKERDRVFQAWQQAVEQERSFEEVLCMTKPDGSTFKVMGYAYPVEYNDKVESYVGKVKIILDELNA
jgi:PAS domain S-box-containing protein